MMVKYQMFENSWKVKKVEKFWKMLKLCFFKNIEMLKNKIKIF